MRSSAREHRVPEFETAEIRGRQHASDAHVFFIRIRKAGQQHAQIAGKRGTLFARPVCEEMPRIQIEPVDIAPYTQFCSTTNTALRAASMS